MSQDKRLTDSIHNDTQGPQPSEQNLFTPLACPRTILLETTNRCNLKCKMCSAKRTRSRRADMPESLYQKIITNLGEHHREIETLSLFMDGEPLIDRRLPGFIQAAKDVGINNVQIATNGTLLQGDWWDALVDSGLDQMIVSIDSLDADVYASIRIGAKLDRVVANVKGFMKRRSQLGLSRPQVTVRLIEMAENSEERDRFGAFWKPVVDRIAFQQLHNWGGSLNDQYSPVNQERCCNWPFRHMVIYSDGRAGFCCLDYEGIYELGDFHHQSLWEIWHGEPYQRLRAHMAAWDMEYLAKCRHCNFSSLIGYKPAHWKKLFISNPGKTPIRVHLKHQEGRRETLTKRRLIPPESSFVWGVPFRQGVVYVVEESGTYPAHEIPLHPYWINYEVRFQDASQR